MRHLILIFVIFPFLFCMQSFSISPFEQAVDCSKPSKPLFKITDSTRVYTVMEVYDYRQGLLSHSDMFNDLNLPGEKPILSNYMLYWDGCDAHGKPVPPGKYTVKLSLSIVNYDTCGCSSVYIAPYK